MDITVNIDDSYFEEPVRTAVARAINDQIRRCVDSKINAYKDKIESAVEKYLEKKLDDKTIISKIDETVARIINERIDER